MFARAEPDVYMERKAEPACIFTVPSPPPRLEGPHRGYGRTKRWRGKACRHAGACCFREGDRNRLSRMEIPRFNSLSDKSPNALSTAVGDRIVDPSTPTGGAPKRPFGGEPSGRFGVAAQGDAPPVCNGDEWPDGDWVPGRVDAKPPAEWAAIAGAIGAGGSTAAPDANTSPASSAEARETSNPTNSSTHEWPVSDPPRRALGESVGAERDVLLWQRWVRYLGAVLMAVAAAVLHTHSRGAITW